ncbi:uncharacterized protein [Drosophila virilis]|uniref:Uncharacterized protein n=1 Tax=Drosophila virilis TaxID=7244 RepID=B4LVU5_DROVI|nr:uncharacterized protein LOC6630350 [Drosophila virilis]EDW67550.1 uncharacterized protein Dvir_GJ24213 [Drosophila virilis]
MRIFAILLGCAVFVLCMIKDSEAVVCTSPGVPTDCVDCTDELNADDAECLAITTDTTEATAAGSATTTTTTATTTAATATTVRSRRKPRRKVVRLTNLQYTNVRRIRVNRNRAPAASFKKRQNKARVVVVG